ncbi:MAG: hypothetical protein JJT81_03735 [Rubellimicrobium sp.]|nr:hypothetical protein [Rubellimicrobium sp.]
MRSLIASMIIGTCLGTGLVAVAQAQSEQTVVTTDADGNIILVVWPLAEGATPPPSSPRIRTTWSTGVFR